MRKSIKITLALLLFSFCFIGNIDAQKKKRNKKEKTASDEVMKVELNNGNTLVGELLKFTTDSIVIMNEQFGRMAFTKSEIKSYSGLDNKDDDPVGWQKEKYQSQYFISPSARPVGKGNSFYTNFNIFANTFSYGLSDNFSVTAGFESISIFAGRFPIVYVNPKLSIPLTESSYVGVGTSVFVVTFDGDVNLGGIMYANSTFGSSIKNFTVGVGFAYTTSETLNDPLFQLGFTVPLSKKVSLLGEAFLTSDIEGLYNIGLRIITKGNILFDAGIARPTGLGTGVGFPLLSLSVPF